MGLFGALFGGGSKGYQSKRTGEYEQNAADMIYNRAGAKRIENPNYGKTETYTLPTAASGAGGKFGNAQYGPTTGTRPVAGSDKQYTWDFSEAGKPVTVDAATSPYAGEFSAYGEAVSGFENPYQYSKSGYNAQTYKPSVFNFGNDSMIDDRTGLEEGLGRSGINKQAAGQLEKTKEMMGTRRPGLFANAANSINRGAMGEGARLSTGLRINAMNQKLDLGRQQQLAQAEENYKAAGLTDDQARFKAQQDMAIEQAQAGENFQNRDALTKAISAQIAQKAGLQQMTQEQQDKAIDYIMGLFSKGNETTHQVANEKNQARGQTLSFLGDMGKTAAMASDIRLKKNIKRIGELPSGLPYYEFEYIWGGGTQVGVMAQEAEKFFPEAVTHDKFGFKMVYYDKIG